MLANVNTTTNGTPPLNCSTSNPTAAKIGATFAYCLIFVVSLAGNSLIGIIVYKTRIMRKPINFFIVNMAISDLGYPIFWIPNILIELYIDYWLINGSLGQALCKLIPFLRDVTTAVSIQSMVLIAVDRFGTVVFPLRSPLFRSKRCLFFILATWIVAMAICHEHLSTNELVEKAGRPHCVEPWTGVFQASPSFKKYMISFVLGTYTPLVLIAMLYAIIYIKVRSQTIPGAEQSANERQPLIRRAEQTVLKVSTVIVLGFAVCRLPFTIVVILAQLVPDIWSCGFLYFLVFALFMLNVHCAMNPCILFLFSKNYRQSLRNAIRCN